MTANNNNQTNTKQSQMSIKEEFNDSDFKSFELIHIRKIFWSGLLALWGLLAFFHSPIAFFKNLIFIVISAFSAVFMPIALAIAHNLKLLKNNITLNLRTSVLFVFLITLIPSLFISTILYTLSPRVFGLSPNFLCLETRICKIKNPHEVNEDDFLYRTPVSQTKVLSVTDVLNKKDTVEISGNSLNSPIHSSVYNTKSSNENIAKSNNIKHSDISISNQDDNHLNNELNDAQIADHNFYYDEEMFNDFIDSTNQTLKNIKVIKKSESNATPSENNQLGLEHSKELNDLDSQTNEKTSTLSEPIKQDDTSSNNPQNVSLGYSTIFYLVLICYFVIFTTFSSICLKLNITYNFSKKLAFTKSLKTCAFNSGAFLILIIAEFLLLTYTKSFFIILGNFIQDSTYFELEMSIKYLHTVPTYIFELVGFVFWLIGLGVTLEIFAKKLVEKHFKG